MHDSVVGSGCYIGIGAIVVGVEIPDGRFVPHGTIVDTADAVDKLPLASEHHREFNEDVVEVNRGLAIAYAAADVKPSYARKMKHKRTSWKSSPGEDRRRSPLTQRGSNAYDRNRTQERCCS